MPLDFPSNPTNGQTFNNFVYDSSITAWRAQGSTNNVGTQIAALNTASPKTVENQAARDALYPAPVQGNSVFRNDLGAVETYYGLYNVSTNPGGRSAAGWYQEPSGRIIQTKSAYPYQSFSTTSTSNVATSLTLSITPTSTTSKIIIGIYAGAMWTSASGSYAFGTIYAGTSSGALTRDLGVGSPMSSVNATNSPSAAPLGIVAIDNPTTTSTLYYTYAMRTSTGSSAGLAYNSTITLMEVSA